MTLTQAVLIDSLQRGAIVTAALACLCAVVGVPVRAWRRRPSPSQRTRHAD